MDRFLHAGILAYLLLEVKRDQLSVFLMDHWDTSHNIHLVGFAAAVCVNYLFDMACFFI